MVLDKVDAKKNYCDECQAKFERSDEEQDKEQEKEWFYLFLGF